MLAVLPPAGDVLQPLTLAGLVELEAALFLLGEMTNYIGGWHMVLPSSLLNFRCGCSLLACPDILYMDASKLKDCLSWFIDNGGVAARPKLRFKILIPNQAPSHNTKSLAHAYSEEHLDFQFKSCPNMGPLPQID